MALNYIDTDGKKYLFDNSQEQAVIRLYDEVKRLRLMLGARTEVVVQELLKEIETMSSVIDASIKYLDS